MYMWNLKNKINTNNHNKSENKSIDIETILRTTRWEGDWGDEKKAKGLRDSCRIDMDMQNVAWGRWLIM